MDKKEKRMRELIDELNAASDAYYGGKEEIMSNFEWDTKFDELASLERETGTILPGSPTQNVSSSEIPNNSNGQKVKHEYPALSLAKTKKVEDLQKWAGSRPVWVSWKLDGLTAVVTYDNGKLSRIATRGNGTIGTDITYMRGAIIGIPEEIQYDGHLVVRGEVLITYPDFEKINAELPVEEQYANPRNLASGTLSLDASRIKEVRERKVRFIAFTLVHTDKDITSWGRRMDELEVLGFITVAREETLPEYLPVVVEKWTRNAESSEMYYPVDGLVLAYDDTEYAATGSVTGHHAERAGLAFKWQDTVAETTLRKIEWSCAATSITPVAIFDPVELEGTTVQRASLVNISEMKRLGIGENDHTVVQVIKANKIIPKIIGITKAEGHFNIPDTCPVCGEKTEIIHGNNGVKVLKCTNPECAAKHLKKFERFVSKQGLDIDGLSIETLRDLIAAGYIHDFADIFKLADHADAVKTMYGFGEKSAENLMAAIEKSRQGVDPVRLITALCIPQIGADAAKKIISACGWSVFQDRVFVGLGFADVPGIGQERSDSITNWFDDDKNREVFEKLLEALDVIDIPPEPVKNGGSCSGLTFVITGELYSFKNRDELKAYIESNGGKVATSVSKKTNYLINNDIMSTSSKNKKAQELGVQIISENEFIERFGK